MAKSVKKSGAAPKVAAANTPQLAEQISPKPAQKKTVASTNGIGNSVHGNGSSVPHDQVAQLAHRFWNERGRAHGHHEEDWLRAEQELRHRAS
ncbi:MAG TPA: DUF2934 domain-containing protein [Terracidiphilus sp.]|jgi:hypothetical protein